MFELGPSGLVCGAVSLFFLYETEEATLTKKRALFGALRFTSTCTCKRSLSFGANETSSTQAKVAFHFLFDFNKTHNSSDKQQHTNTFEYCSRFKLVSGIKEN